MLDARRLVARAQKCGYYQFADGFDNYNSASLMYETVAGSPVYGTSYRRFAPPSGLPGQGVYLPSTAWLKKNMKSNQPTLIPKIAYCPLSLPSSVTNILAATDGNSGGVSQVNIGVLNSGAIAAYRAFNTPSITLLGTSAPGIIAANQYYGIEALFTVNSTSGVVQVWVNGVEVLNLSGFNTQGTSNAYANQVEICDSGNLGCYIDDFRVWDSTGSTMNAPLGTDSRFFSKLPSGAGSLAQLTPNGASANWQCVDDNPPDGDTTYVSGSSSGLVDELAAPIAGFTQPPAMVVARVYARKDDGSTRSLEFGVVSGSATAVSSAGTVTVGSTYAFYDGAISDDPNTSAPWTAAAADAAGFWKEETA